MIEYWVTVANIKFMIFDLRQVAGKRLTISKCFGILIAAGRNLRQGDLQLLEIEHAKGAGEDNTVCDIFEIIYFIWFCYASEPLISNFWEMK